MSNLYALVRNGALVEPNVPFLTSNAITTEWPDAADEPVDCEWLLVVDDSGKTRGKPIYRVQDDVVIRSYREDA
jgi:hypothetical protein